MKTASAYPSPQAVAPHPQLTQPSLLCRSSPAQPQACKSFSRHGRSSPKEVAGNGLALGRSRALTHGQGRPEVLVCWVCPGV